LLGKVTAWYVDALVPAEKVGLIVALRGGVDVLKSSSSWLLLLLLLTLILVYCPSGSKVNDGGGSATVYRRGWNMRIIVF
jgi:hypothetical protein